MLPSVVHVRGTVFVLCLVVLTSCGDSEEPTSGDPGSSGSTSTNTTVAEHTGDSDSGEATTGGTTASAGTDADPVAAPGAIHFVDEAAARGITGLNHCGSADQKRYLMEGIGNGCALFDYDMDGDVDLYVVDSCTVRPPAEGEGEDWVAVMDGQCRLYENDGTGHFTDVTERSGAGFQGFAQGASVVDYDGDGDPDLYVTAWGPNLLFRNEGPSEDGVKFTEVAVEAGVADDYWSVGSCWLDVEGDGDLDLYVANYFAMAVERDPDCWRKIECPYQDLAVICGPKGMVAEVDHLFLNQGDGTFVDGSKDSGIHEVEARYGLGVVAFDYNLDGAVDIYVANDSRGNFLFENDGQGRFIEMADLTGSSLSRSGLPQAGMGIGCGDWDNDGDGDLFLTNFSHDYNTLYRNDKGLDFLDVSRRLGFSEIDYFSLGWGAEFVDLDHDGWQDLVVCNGHVYPEADQRAPELAYRQQNRLYRNTGDDLEDVTDQAGPGFQKLASSRGMAAGDLDGDGDLDLVIVEQNEPPTVLINHLQNERRFLLVSLTGRGANTDAIGARVTIQDGTTTQVREKRSGHSFASSHDPRLHFGAGDAATVRIEVLWPGGATDVFEDVATNQWVHITRIPEPADGEAGARIEIRR